VFCSLYKLQSTHGPLSVLHNNRILRHHKVTTDAKVNLSLSCTNRHDADENSAVDSASQTFFGRFSADENMAANMANDTGLGGLLLNLTAPWLPSKYTFVLRENDTENEPR